MEIAFPDKKISLLIDENDKIGLEKKIDDSDIAFIFPHQLEMLSKNGLDLILAIDCIHEIDKPTIQYYFKFNKYPKSFFVD